MGNCLEEYLAKSGNVPGGFLGILVVFFGGFLREMVHIPEGFWPIPVRFLGQCPGTSCNQLVGCWRPFAGKLGRLPWETSGQSCKGLWGVCPIPHAFLSDCFGESRKVLGGSWLVRGNSRKYWPSLCGFRPGRHRSSPNQASSQMVTI